MKRMALAAIAMLALPPSAAEPFASEADAPETRARAREALARGQRLPVAGETLAIQGLEVAIVGLNVAIDGLLRDLDAEVRGREVRIALSADVLFDFDRADLRPEAAPALEKVAAVLKSYPKASARIEGHTDSKGDDVYNQKLSERRAESVRKYLAANGATLRMSTRGWGEKKPVAPNAGPDGRDDPDGRRRNRRVEITVRRL